MYAVFRTGGKQYRVAEGDLLEVEKLSAEAGTTVEFDEVLLVGSGDEVKIGAPLVTGGKVTAAVQAQTRGRKIQIIKFRRRKHHMKRQGHRQHLTQIRITGISAG